MQLQPDGGAVIVCDGKIIGEGYHVRCGEAHAEVNAIRSVKDPYVAEAFYNLRQPGALCPTRKKHQPCADLIIEKKITAHRNRLPGPVCQSSRTGNPEAERCRAGSHHRGAGR